MSLPDLIAQTVLVQFDKLPPKRKPSIRDNGVHEWVPLAGIVAEKNGKLTCLALATGMKCLPATKMAESNGVALHDWHAEILAIRIFNRFLLDECRKVLVEKAVSDFLMQRDETRTPTSSCPFVIRDDVKLHMYCSEAPCGDASMELIMAAQADDSPWEVPAAMPGPSDQSSLSEGILPGRAYFSQLGIVRRKPARGDAPPTMSKSCSDKLALKQCTSLLGSIMSLLVDPSTAYLSTFVLPQSQMNDAAFNRAFSEHGRMEGLSGRQFSGGYAFHPVSVQTTNAEFACSREVLTRLSAKIAGSNIASAWSLSGIEETIINGVLLGRKPFDVKGASSVSRRQMWAAACAVASHLEDDIIAIALSRSQSYGLVKDGALLASRRAVKEEVRRTGLPGWVRNEGDSEFNIAPDR